MTFAENGDLASHVRHYVQDVLAWDKSVGQVERINRGSQSSHAMIERIGELGIVGTGCSGTKGVGRARIEVDLETAHVDPIAAARYRRLRGEALRVTDAVIADAQGDSQVELVIGFDVNDSELKVRCNLAQRIARIVCPLDVVMRWHGKILGRDQTPALVAAEREGEKFLAMAADAWWRVIE